MLVIIDVDNKPDLNGRGNRVILSSRGKNEAEGFQKLAFPGGVGLLPTLEKKLVLLFPALGLRHLRPDGWMYVSMTVSSERGPAWPLSAKAGHGLVLNCPRPPLTESLGSDRWFVWGPAAVRHFGKVCVTQGGLPLKELLIPQQPLTLQLEGCGDS